MKKRNLPSRLYTNCWVLLIAINWFSPSMAQTMAPTTNSTMLLDPTATPTSDPSTSPSAVSPPSDLSFPTTAPPTSVATSPPTPVPTGVPTTDEDDDDGNSSGTNTTMSLNPSAIPSPSPSVVPSTLPTDALSAMPTASGSNSPTSSRSASPSTLPSIAPTSNPTIFPSSGPTMSPSSLPTEKKNLVEVESIVPLELKVTPSLLIGETEKEFISATEAFLTAELPEVSLIVVSIVKQYRALGQRRILQNGDPLFVDLGVSGFLSGDDPSYDFDSVLINLFETKSDDYVAVLQSTELDYFESLIEVGVNMPSETPAPVASPGTTPTSNPVIAEDDDDGFPMGAIIGIVVAAVVALGLVVCFFSNKTSKDSNAHEEENSLRPSSPLALADSSRPQNSQGIQRGESDLESQALYSYVQGDDSIVGGASAMQNNSFMGGDTMSYAFSLEPGVDTGTVDGSAPPNIPMEIPQFGASNRQESEALESFVSSTRDSEYGAEPALDGMSLATEDLKLTESELAMLPSDLANTTSDTGHEEPPTRKLIAPPGKLGIVIDTTVEGPVVHFVNENSALIGKIWAGDIIIAIDDVDTRAMSASAITELMVKTANQKRVLTIVSGSK